MASGFLLVLLLAGCEAGGTEPALLDPRVELPSSAALPPLPQAKTGAPEPQVQHHAAGFTRTVTLGGLQSAQYNEYATPYEGVGAMKLSAPANGCAWALYSFTGIGAEDTPSELEIALSGPWPEKIWIGLSDYSAGQWHWQVITPEAYPIYLGLLDLSQPTSTAGKAHIVVLTTDGIEATLGFLRLHLIGWPPAPPTPVTVQKGPETGQFTLNWTKAQCATGYRVYRDNQEFTYEAVGDVDSWVDVFANGLDHTYWLRAENIYGISSFSLPAYGRQGDWQIHLVDRRGDGQTALAIADGRPLIICDEAWEDDGYLYSYVQAVHATSAAPRSSADWQRMRFDRPGDPRSTGDDRPSLALVDGNPVFTIGEKYLYATIPNPSARDDWIMHRYAEKVGSPAYAPLVVFDGLPHIAFIDTYTDTVKYVQGLTLTPSDSSDWLISDVYLDVPHNPDNLALAFIDKRPAVCFAQREPWESPGDLRFAHATTAKPSEPSDWQTHIVETMIGYPTGVHRLSMLELANGAPAICYFGRSMEVLNLRFATASSNSPVSAGDWQIATLRADVDSASRNLVTVLRAGKPCIGLRLDGALLAGCSEVESPTQAEDWTFDVVDEEAGNHTIGMVEFNGGLACSYIADDALFFAVSR